MSEQVTQANVSQEVTVNIQISVNGRNYVLLIPSGVPYQEAYTVALEMSSVIKKMQENAIELAEKNKAAQEVSDGQ